VVSSSIAVWYSDKIARHFNYIQVSYFTMVRILISAITVLLLSCNQKATQTVVAEPSAVAEQILDIDSLVFDFDIPTGKSAGVVPGDFILTEDKFKLNCSLLNNNKDTVYLLTRTCDGLIYHLQFDTSRFDLFPLRYCNASFPVIEKLPPDSVLKFDAVISMKGKQKSFRAGFDFIRVPPDFDLKMDHVVLFRKKQKSRILWADEKQMLNR
jgi:hypothetical protein